MPTSHFKSNEYVPFDRTCTQTTFTSEGHVILPPKSHKTNFARHMLQIAKYFIVQLPYSNFKLDSTIFLSAFYTKEEGVCVHEGRWDAGPNDDNDDVRIAIAQRWAEMVNRKEQVIPTIAARGTRDIINMVKEHGARSRMKPPVKKHKGVESTCRFCGMINWSAGPRGKYLFIRS